MTYVPKEVADALIKAGIPVRYFPNAQKFTVNGQMPEMTNGGDDVWIKLRQPIHIQGSGYPILGHIYQRREVEGLVKTFLYNQRTHELQTSVSTEDGHSMPLRGISFLQTQESKLETIARAETESGKAVCEGARSTEDEPWNFGPSALGIDSQISQN